jgi:predicted RNA methylase
MGVSDPTNKPYAEELISWLKPKTVIDVGAGAGIYGDIVRRVAPDAKLIAIEAWKPYIDQFNLTSRYDEVINMDVREVESLEADLVIFGDILEHMSQEDAVELWGRVAQQARYAIISVPIVHWHQDAINGNPYEVHVKEDWDEEQVLAAFSNIVEYELFPQTGTFLAKFGDI